MANAGFRPRLLARVRQALEPAADHYEILDTGLAQRMGGLLWVVGGLVALAILPLAPPDAEIGAWGWAIAGCLIGAALLCAALLLRERVATPAEMFAMSVGAPLLVALLQWLAGPSSPYAALLVLSTLWSASSHTPRRAFSLALMAGAVALAPLAYGPWTDGAAALRIM